MRFSIVAECHALGKARKRLAILPCKAQPHALGKAVGAPLLVGRVGQLLVGQPLRKNRIDILGLRHSNSTPKQSRKNYDKFWFHFKLS